MQEISQHISTSLQAFEPTHNDIHSIEAVVRLTRIPRYQIAVYCRHGLISPVREPERDGWWFNDEAIRSLRRIETLRVDHGINLAGLRIVSALVCEVEQLREEVRMLRRV